MDNLSKKTIIITGASAGIGWATSVSLAARGARLVLFARREDKLRELTEHIDPNGGHTLVIPGDSGKEEDIDRMLNAALQWDKSGGIIDAVLVNAGRGLAGSLLTSDAKQWKELYMVNVLGASYLMRRAGEIMSIRGRGDIIVIGSVAGHNISPFSGFYGSSKFAIGAAAEALRRELCPHGVKVTLVKPGVVISEFQEVAGYTQENFGKGVAAYGKLLEPEDVASSIEWILSQPEHVNISEIIVRPTGQNYP